MNYCAAQILLKLNIRYLIPEAFLFVHSQVTGWFFFCIGKNSTENCEISSSHKKSCSIVELKRNEKRRFKVTRWTPKKCLKLTVKKEKECGIYNGKIFSMCTCPLRCTVSRIKWKTHWCPSHNPVQIFLLENCIGYSSSVFNSNRWFCSKWLTVPTSFIHIPPLASGITCYFVHIDCLSIYLQLGAKTFCKILYFFGGGRGKYIVRPHLATMKKGKFHQYRRSLKLNKTLIFAK